MYILEFEFAITIFLYRFVSLFSHVIKIFQAYWSNEEYDNEKNITEREGRF